MPRKHCNKSIRQKMNTEPSKVCHSSLLPQRTGVRFTSLIQKQLKSALSHFPCPLPHTSTNISEIPWTGSPTWLTTLGFRHLSLNMNHFCPHERPQTPISTEEEAADFGVSWGSNTRLKLFTELQHRAT